MSGPISEVARIRRERKRSRDNRVITHPVLFYMNENLGDLLEKYDRSVM